MNEERLAKVRTAARSEGIEIAVFDDSAMEETAESVFEKEYREAGTYASYSREFMVYEGFTVEAVRSFSHTLKRYGIAFDGIRIRLGTENRKWSVKQLLETAEAEYETAVKLRVLQRLVQAAAMYLQKEAGGDTGKLRQYCQEAYAYLNGKEYEAGLTDLHCRRLSGQLRSLERTLH